MSQTKSPLGGGPFDGIPDMRFDLKETAVRTFCYFFPPVGGGVLKAPLRAVENTQAGNTRLSFFGAISEIWRTGGMRAFGEGFYAQVARTLPSGAACIAYVNYEKQRNAEPTGREYVAIGTKAGFLESIIGAVPEGREFSKKIATARSAPTWQRAAATAALSWPRNAPYWIVAAYAGHKSDEMKVRHGPLFANVFKITTAIAVAVGTTPLGILTAKGWSHASINVPKLVKIVMEESGPKGLASGAIARGGVVGISALLSMTAFEKLAELDRKEREELEGEVPSDKWVFTISGNDIRTFVQELTRGISCFPDSLGLEDLSSDKRCPSPHSR